MSLSRVARRFCGSIALLLYLSACGGFDRNRYMPSSPDFIDALILSVERSTIPADGFSTTKITAKISADSAPERRTIVFNSTKGTFAGSGSPETAHIESAVDVTGTTTVLLRSTTTVETANVTATVKDATTAKDVPGVAKQAVISFGPVDADDVLSLTVTSPSLPADGFSRTRLTATVKTLGDPNRRSVTFKASKGTLVSSEAPKADGSVVVPTDGNGVAIVELQSSSTVESAFVSASVGTAGAGSVTKTATVAFTAPDPDTIIRIFASSSTAAADGAARIQITAIIAGGIPSVSRTVEFVAGGATFATGSAADLQRASVTPDASNRAVVDLIAPTTAKTVRVTATVNKVSVDTLVTFTVALPNRIFVSPALGSHTATTNNLISVSLLRDVGVASVNQVVTYTAKDANGNPVGVFSGTTLSVLNAAQMVTVSSSTYNHAGGATGLVTIEASVGGVTGSAVIRIVP